MKYKVICDETNNTEENKANRELIVNIEITPDEVKYQILFDAEKDVVEYHKYYRLGYRWFEIIDGKLGDEIIFVPEQK